MDKSLLVSISFLMVIFSGIGVLIFILWYNNNKAIKKKAEILSMTSTQNNDSSLILIYKNLLNY